MAILIIIIVAIAGLVTLVFFLDRRRQGQFAAWAAERRWSYHDGRDEALSHSFAFVDAINPKLSLTTGGLSVGAKRTEDRYATHVLSGDHQGRRATAFTHHYAVVSDDTDDDGNRRQSRDSKFHSLVALQLETNFPELKIGRDNLFKRAKNKVTGGDIEFESAEFNKKFEVRSAQRAFAVAVCNPQMIEYLLSRPIDSIELQGNWIVSTATGKLSLDSVEPRLAHLHRIRELMPAELFHGRA